MILLELLQVSRGRKKTKQLSSSVSIYLPYLALAVNYEDNLMLFLPPRTLKKTRGERERERVF